MHKMTRVRGAVSPVDGAPTPANPSGTFQRLPKLPANAPDIVVKNTIYLNAPGKVLAWGKEERERNFRHLVRRQARSPSLLDEGLCADLVSNRYINQLLHGCKEPLCTTPTCFSYRKRVAEAPLRKFTALSARTVACYLASQDNPENGLCRNEPLVPHGTYTLDAIQRPKKHSKKIPREPKMPESKEREANGHVPHPHSRKSEHHAEEFEQKCLQSQRQAKTQPREDLEQRVEETKSQELQRETTEEAHDAYGRQKVKDPKSFTQNLFDTFPLRMLEWLPLRRSPHIFDSPPKEQKVEDPIVRSENEDAKGLLNGHGGTLPAISNLSQRPTSNKANGGIKPGHKSYSSPNTTKQSAAVEVKLPREARNRFSTGDLEHQKPHSKLKAEEQPVLDQKRSRKLSLNTPSSTTTLVSVPTSAPAPKQRRHKHKDPFSDSDQVTRKQQKQRRRVSWDGSKLLQSFAEREDEEDRDPSPTEVHHPLPPAIIPSSHEHPKRSAMSSPESSHGAQSVSHLSEEIVRGLGEMMFHTDSDMEQWKEEMKASETQGTSGHTDWGYATTDQRQASPFISQSIFYVLSTPQRLIESFQERVDPKTDDEPPENQDHVNPSSIYRSFQGIYFLSPFSNITHSLWQGLESLFIPPPTMSSSLKSRNKLSRSSKSSGTTSSPVDLLQRATDASDGFISDAQASHISMIVLSALTAAIPLGNTGSWQGFCKMRASGTVLPDPEMQKLCQCQSEWIVEATDKFEDELALRLMNRLVRAIAARLAFFEISKTRANKGQTPEIEKAKPASVVDMIIRQLRKDYKESLDSNQREHRAMNSAHSDYQITMAAAIVEWLRTLLLREWDGKAETPRSGPVGGAVQFLASMYKDRANLGLSPEDFHTPFLSDRLDPMEMPIEWLGSPPNNKIVHLLSYSFLFPPSALVAYFRSLNFAAMSKSFEAAMTSSRHVVQMAYSEQGISVPSDTDLVGRMRTSMSTYLVLVIRRDSVLTDALNQLWRREKRELLRPLKVRMGMDEGEEGVDHGGVQQEFFRVLMGEALDPEYGMFTTDPQTRMSWFAPGCFEPHYKFELLGLLVSIAVYNGITLPVTFPIALYRKLLGLKVKTVEHIRDGWPELAKGLEKLLSWKDGDVGDIFMRTYEISFEVFGHVLNIDMERIGEDGTSRPYVRRRNSKGIIKSYLLEDIPERSATTKRGTESTIESEPTPLELPEPSLVTNANREQYVKDHIFWLTNKSNCAAYDAFAHGFYRCLDRTALSIFTPEALKTVVEGIQEIDMDELERTARYEDGYNTNHRVIKDFWSVVKGFSLEKKRQLLEFVTASDRVPVNGINSVMFVIQRNGTDDEVSVMCLEVVQNKHVLTTCTSVFQPVLPALVGSSSLTTRRKRSWRKS